MKIIETSLKIFCTENIPLIILFIIFLCLLGVFYIINITVKNNLKNTSELYSTIKDISNTFAKFEAKGEERYKAYEKISEDVQKNITNLSYKCDKILHITIEHNAKER